MKAHRIRHVLVRSEAASKVEAASSRFMKRRDDASTLFCRRDVCNPIPQAFIVGGESWLSVKFNEQIMEFKAQNMEFKEPSSVLH